MTDDEILYSYIIIKTEFSFKETVKYPSIPCFIDKNTTVYPLKGSAILTGAEYILARNIGCVFKIQDIYLIPFKTAKTDKGKELGLYTDRFIHLPFRECVKDLQALRRKYPKTHVYNQMYKSIANSLYGLTTKGLSNKMKYDFRTKTSFRMRGNELSNPLIASWITAYIRSVLGELLHNISLLDGVVVSVTTDGFMTNLENVEDLILNNKSLNSYLLKSYRYIREILSNEGVGLELKNSGVGIISWTTRGQFGGDGKIVATTGLQRINYNTKELEELLKDTFKSSGKSTEFIQKSLRSGLDLLKEGGTVTPVYKDKMFRMLYDNRRVMNDKYYVGELRDSKPSPSVDKAKLNRFIGR